MALPLHPAAALLLLLVAAPVLCAAQSPISLPPSPGAPTASPTLHPEADGDQSAASPSLPPSVDSAAAASPPAPTETSPLASPTEAPVSAAHSPAPASSLHSGSTPTIAPAPAPGADEQGDDDYTTKKKAPAPAPAAMEVKAGAGGADQQQQEVVDRPVERGMDGGKKAGVVVGAFSAAAVLCLAAVVYRKRQANIRRSRYADYSARLELV